jgi:hypothetical protein
VRFTPVIAASLHITAGVALVNREQAGPEIAAEPMLEGPRGLLSGEIEDSVRPPTRISAYSTGKDRRGRVQPNLLVVG